MIKLTTFILIMGSSLIVFSQNNSSEFKAEGQIESGKPTVYMEYICHDKNKVSLRLHNNTVWTIAVSTDRLYYRTNKVVKLANGKEFYTMPDNKEVSLQYGVEKYALPSENVKVPTVSRNDATSTSWIASGDSVLFSVPIEYLRQDLMVFVKFNYEWEVDKKGFIVIGPEHRLLFRGIDIPDKQITCGM